MDSRTALTDWELQQARMMVDVAREQYWYGLPFELVNERLYVGLGTRMRVDREAWLSDLVRTDADTDDDPEVRRQHRHDVRCIRRLMFSSPVGAATLRHVAARIFSSPAAAAFRATGQYDGAAVIWEQLQGYAFDEQGRRSRAEHRQRVTAETMAAILAEAEQPGVREATSP